MFYKLIYVERLELIRNLFEGIQRPQKFQLLEEQLVILDLHTKEAIILQKQSNMVKLLIIATIQKPIKADAVPTMREDMGKIRMKK